MKYFFEIAYKGTNYHGWQSQKNALGIQEVINNALSTILGSAIVCTGSSRTDTGVHALKQFFHIEVETKLDDNFRYRLNSFLPNDITIMNIFNVVDSAHCRFDAVSRSYQYKISKVKDPFMFDTAIFVSPILNLQKMQKAASLLIGEHDFTSFSKVKTDVKNFRCNVEEATWSENNNLLLFDIKANHFLRGMVRTIVGTMLEIGHGKIAFEDFNRIIKSKDRKKAGAAAPAKGLALMSVEYPFEIFLNE